MASKGQKFNHHSDELISIVVEEYFSGMASRGFLAKKYNIPDGTIANWLYKYKKNGNIKRNNHLKGRKKDENIDYKERYEILKKYQAFLKAQRERK